ncbi:hypothetical protein [Dolichospermum sp. LEGE 00246]|uniref:hypothetical protein n=1 Tax=Dolichospermum sp. LEGE 00246 TaxID=1828605 RepID=UPI001D14DCD7|nr:hypothetical protein [Dolichospermum sp. LEGE 00246]
MLIMKHWITSITLLMLLVFPTSALAQTKVGIQVDAKDKPLKITAWLGNENNFIGNLRLTAADGDIPNFTFLASDLKRKEGDEIISREKVELTSKSPLSAEVPKDFQVKVNGVQVPGTYEGEIELLLPGQKRSQALVIPLTVIAKTKPAIEPLGGAKQLQLQLVQCSIDCGLAHLLLPASAFQEQRQLLLDNPVLAPVSLSSAEVVLEGKKTGYQITKEVVAPNPQVLAANKIVSLPLSWKRSHIPPDHYTGAVYLTLEGREERLLIPIDLSMRTGPFLPLLVLLVGIALGRLLKYMQSKGIPQSDALGKVNELQREIAETDPEDEKILTPMVQQVRKLVYQMDLETVKAELGAIAGRLNCLRSLRTMEQKLTEKKQHPKVGGEKGILQKIDPFSDYLGLVLWGLSTDVASRSLSNLSGGEKDN